MRLCHRFAIAGSCAARENVVVMTAGGVNAGIVVDALCGPRQTVVKPLGKRFPRVPGIAGSAILGNGRVALIVDPGGLLRDVIEGAERENRGASSGAGLEL